MSTLILFFLFFSPFADFFLLQWSLVHASLYVATFKCRGYHTVVLYLNLIQTTSCVHTARWQKELDAAYKCNVCHPLNPYKSLKYAAFGPLFAGKRPILFAT